ncbi:protocadherin-11 X-linked [Elysia marginata]|uniref:Protocadherin-11 X-linked n=1 Tax=Elysia marginata TaxID=1093978 RepID=A0AAV4I782_9GAST|nr:protocadherin-11 X-linked [Elysia marginata]
MVIVVSLCSSVTKAQSVAFEIQEEQLPPKLIGNIGVSANITAVPGLTYSLLQQGSSFEDLFEVDENSGDVRTRTALDREDLCGSLAQCILLGSVLVSSSESNFIRRLQVNITVVDANDQRPMWTVTPYSTTISERAAMNTTFQLPVAEDKDYEPFFKVQRYALESPGSSAFDLSVRKTTQPDGYITFEVYLRLVRKLDRERKEKYDMTLVAYDGNGPTNNGKLPLVINVGDENDNAPQFSVSRYVRSVQDVTPPGTTVLKVSATDVDSGENARVGYMFPNAVDKRIQELFRLDPVTGDLKLNQSLGKETTLTFKVRAFDHGKTAMFSDAEVVVNVEDTLNDPPRMEISHINFNGSVDFVKENTPVENVVAFVDAIDNDGGKNGQVTCLVEDECFELKTFSPDKNYMLVIKKELDRETQATHKLTITCEDQGTPALTSSVEMTIAVTDVNDFSPEFTTKVYRMSVRENQLKDVPVGPVQALDKDEGANGDVRYSLPADVVEFNIDSNGLITTAVRDLDRESKDTYIFEVYAFDMAVPPRTATASVVVTVEDLNDEWPKFDKSSYHFQISESAEVNKLVGKIHASDLDLGKGGVVEYVLVHAPAHPNPPFSLSQASGSMTLIRGLDYEEEDQYKFVVTAIDLGDPPRSSTVEVVIDLLDENDNSPVISFPSSDNLSVTLNLNVIPGHEVIQVIAHDADSGDNGRLSYSMSAAPNTSSDEAVSRLFWMNEDTGLVTLVAPLTAADARSYNIVVNVQDHGQSPQRATQAMLVVQVVEESGQASDSRRESYTTIVIAMVCVTLLVAVIVLVILCYIKYSDRRRYLKSKNPDGHLHLHNPSHSDHQFDHKPVTSDPTSGKYDLFILENGSSSDGHDGSGDRSVDPLDPTISPTLQKQPLKGHQNHTRMGSGPRSGKKSVTFDSKVRSSDNSLHNTGSTQVALQDPVPLSRSDRYSVSPVPSPFFAPVSPDARNLSSSQTQNIIFNPNVTHKKDLVSNTHSQSPSPHNLNQDSLNNRVGWNSSGISSFRPNTSSSPSPFPAVLNAPPAYPAATIRSGPMPQASSSGPAPDDVVGVALQKHNALVRSMRANGRRPPYAGGQARRTSGEADICSSSSVETNDSGHGGSELDVSVMKAHLAISEIDERLWLLEDKEDCSGD